MRLRHPIHLDADGYYRLPRDAPEGARLGLEFVGDGSARAAWMIVNVSAHAALCMLGEGWEKVDG